MSDGRTLGVLGGGPWGISLASAAARAGSDVVLFSRRPHDRLDGVRTTDRLADLAKARLVLVAMPSTVARSVLAELGDHLDGAHLLVHGIRGLGGNRLETISDIVREETPVRRIGALGGPVQASELAAARPSAMVCASNYPEVTKAVTAVLQSSSLKVFSSPDLRGLEWASALVGCLAVGVGYAKEVGAGPGLLAALISRGVDEAAKIAAAAGAEERTMYGLGGYGDLLASIALEDRPEVVLGRALGRGRSLDDAIAEAKLRVEAISLIPRVSAFASDHKVAATSFRALGQILRGGQRDEVLGQMF